MRIPSKNLSIPDKQGFALIVTISMMILLALLAVGLLNLSTVALRGSNAQSLQIEARQNARMALVIAIGASFIGLILGIAFAAGFRETPAERQGT